MRKDRGLVKLGICDVGLGDEKVVLRQSSLLTWLDEI